MIHNVNSRQLLIGSVALMVGALIYLFDRDPNSVFLIYKLGIPTTYSVWTNGYFGALGDSLPSFIHVFSFSLLTCALWPKQTNRIYLSVCVIWFSINIIFEISQIIKPGGSAQPISDNGYIDLIAGYSRYGTFDYMDILFIVIGFVFAYITLHMTMEMK